ncbi:hypothetical protein KO498_12030 [Lentibacter algarum]|uniref:hypothetical protein n=1 Tax=Lentibacter algarum TaxID=576131 RepID=UPI001C080DD8|nr:hypothetical protein [Lentibacter algarum]MBU2982538.1 hypothetical protein [Lentibacter algarum]
MTFELFQSATYDLLIVRYPHDATLMDGTASLTQFAATANNAGPKFIVVDCGAADASELSFRNVFGVAARKALVFRELPRCRKLVLLVRNELQFGFARMYQTLLDERIDFELEIACDEGTAIESVGLKHDSLETLIAEISVEDRHRLA